MNQDIQAVTEATRKAECWSAVTTRREPEVLSRQGTRTDGYDVTARDRKQTEPAEVSPLHDTRPGIGQRGAWFMHVGNKQECATKVGVNTYRKLGLGWLQSRAKGRLGGDRRGTDAHHC